MILSHKGNTEVYASSTKESVLSALDRWDGVELDLNISKDGVFYFYHEGDWITHILARRCTFAELGRFVPAGESVLSLPEAVELVRQAGKCLLIHAEIGGGGRLWAHDFSNQELQAVLSIIGESDIARNQVFFHTLHADRAAMLGNHVCFLRNTPRKRHGMYRFAKLMELLPGLDPGMTMAYTINDEDEFQSLIDWGVGYILTDSLVPRTGRPDDHTYYSRVGPRIKAKNKAIRDFVLARNDIKFLFDVGCNNGDMSHQFVEHGIKVLGMDISADLQIPDGYDFIQRDITTCQTITFSDCTLFLSLYHHICYGEGLALADDLFYKLLLRTNYLVFDCGNVQERGVCRQKWIRSLRRHFSNEQELLNHFGLRYAPIGTWQTGGANRTIVVFERRVFDQGVDIIDEFRRRVGAAAQRQGLTSVEAIDDPQEFYQGTVFYKLGLVGKLFFAKKHVRNGKKRQWRELAKIIEVYNKFPENQLLKFYGVSDRFGLIYEWVDDFSYRGKARALTLHGVHLPDADVIKVGEQLKVIDFAS